MQVHFIGLGEVEMFNVALALHKKGDTVTGSDELFDESLKDVMRDQGLMWDEIGWFSNRVNSQLDFVVLGANVTSDNPELEKAKELGLRLVSCPEFLYELVKLKTRVVIAGSQRRSEVVSMILHVLDYNNIEVDYVLSSPNGIHLTSISQQCKSLYMFNDV